MEVLLALLMISPVMILLGIALVWYIDDED